MCAAEHGDVDVLCDVYSSVDVLWDVCSSVDVLCDVYSSVDVLYEMYMVRACYRGGCTWLCGCFMWV